MNYQHFEPGDRVRFRSYEEMDREHLLGLWPSFIPQMRFLCGQEAIIKKVVSTSQDYNRVYLERTPPGGDRGYTFAEWMFELIDDPPVVSEVELNSILGGML